MFKTDNDTRENYRTEAVIQVVLMALFVIVLVGWYAGLSTLAYADSVVMFVAFAGALPVVIRAVKQLGTEDWASMDLLASIALGLSLANREWTSSVFIAFMLAAAHLLALLTEARTERTIASLLRLRPEKANVKRDGTIVEIPVEQVVVGDIVVIDTGDRISVDGIVIEGEATIDESSLTGESIPVEKERGSRVLASTLLVSGGISVCTEKAGTDTTLGKIIDLVRSAREQRSKMYTLAERFGKIYLVLIFLSAIIVYLVTRDMRLVLAVVLVVCADDVAIAVPLAFVSAIGSAARRGVIVKGSMHLEALGRIKTFVFDKTGTLTTGKLTVSHIIPMNSESEREVLRLAAIPARRSHHPLAKAIAAHADVLGMLEEDPDTCGETGGKGVEATYKGEHIIIGRTALLESRGVVISPEVSREIMTISEDGHSISLVARNNIVIGIIALADEIKPGAVEALYDLRSLGVERIVMLTGDNEKVASVIAAQLGISEYHAGLLPEDKVAFIKDIAAGGELAMVGDGVNDAAALSYATVGIAMGAIGYDAAIESAHVVLMKDALSGISDTIRLARFVHRITIGDFIIWGIANTIGLGFVFFGGMGPSAAAAYNFISDFFPLAYSLRVRNWRP
ncbi:MAG: cation-translocating P-type ATPase [Candidatus Yonathbacteria bacterium]|nr:cation-translocating P-type ATPase [Candidatus Yonathbacteria bacterium]